MYDMVTVECIESKKSEGQTSKQTRDPSVDGNRRLQAACLFQSTDESQVINYQASLLIACQNFRQHSNIIHMMFFANFCTEIC